MRGWSLRAVGRQALCRRLLITVFVWMAGAAAAGLRPFPILVTNTANSGEGSLRQALLEALRDGADTVINFAIPGEGPHIIRPVLALPVVPFNTVIDASNARDAEGNPLIIINGSLAGAGANGLNVAGSGCVIFGLAINGFDGSGLVISAPPRVIVSGCVIGNDLAPNGNGIEIVAPSGAARNGATLLGHVIGGTSSPEANVISGNTGAGILISGGNSVQIFGNRIGTNREGTAASANGRGVEIVAPNNSVGGDEIGAGNVISGNFGEAIRLVAGNTAVQGNIIGLAADGMTPLPNGGDGVRVFGLSCRIGGTVPGARNVISANAGNGIRIGSGGVVGGGDARVDGNFIGTDVTGGLARGNGGDGVLLNDDSTGNFIGEGAGNLISANTGAGIRISGGGAGSNLIFRNTMGTDVTGTQATDPSDADLGNGVGIQIEIGAGSNLIGNASESGRNVISGNGVGIVLDASNDNVIRGNHIGLFQGPGSRGIPQGTGVLVQNGSEGNFIGGFSDGAGNVISENSAGVDLRSSSNFVQGNLIGPAADGVTLVGNQSAGIQIVGSPGGTNGNLIGGAAIGEGNVISGNRIGINMGASANLNLIQGNRIGTDPTGKVAVPNSGIGIVVNGSSTTIGGSGLAGNLISGNGHGIICDAGEGHQILGNTIGLDADGLPLPNQRIGIRVGSLRRCRISQNSIFANGELGIDLMNAEFLPGVSPNDPDDSDMGGNELQNFPVLEEADVSLQEPRFTGVLRSLPNTTYTIELFVSEGTDFSGHGEGQHFLTSFNVTTTADGSIAWQHQQAITFRPGRFITATATDPDGNTSEFSEALEINDSLPSPNEILFALLGLIPLREDHDFNEDGTTDVGDLVLLSTSPG